MTLTKARDRVTEAISKGQALTDKHKATVGDLMKRYALTEKDLTYLRELKLYAEEAVEAGRQIITEGDKLLKKLPPGVESEVVKQSLVHGLKFDVEALDNNILWLSNINALLKDAERSGLTTFKTNH